MYAIIEDGGQQFKVEEGQEFEVDYRQAAPGEQVTFDRVLAYRDDRGLHVGRPTLESASVLAEVIGPSQGEKLTVQKFRRRKTYRRKYGHRQLFTRIRIEKIDVNGTS
jgi:large subunit ribosomal protein L21